MPRDQQNLECEIDESVRLVSQISAARSSLQSSAQKLAQMQSQQAIVDSAKRNLGRLFDQASAWAKKVKVQQHAKEQLGIEVKQLQEKLEQLRWQTSATELYLASLDSTMEAAMRTEAADAHQRGAVTPKQGAASGAASESVAEWSKDEEIEYLSLREQQNELRGDVCRLEAEVARRKDVLRDMLATLVDGEASLRGKGRYCAELEREAEVLRKHLDSALQEDARHEASQDDTQLDFSGDGEGPESGAMLIPTPPDRRLSSHRATAPLPS